MNNLLLLVIAVGSAWAAGPVSGPHADPHADPHACGACHAPTAGGEPVGPARPDSETCVACHPDADMHPVGIAPETVPVPEAFPLQAGLLSCRTCHLTPAHDGQAGAPAPYLRGGPHADRGAFCFQCHEAEDYARQDPHHGTEQAPTCAACHVARPSEGAAPADARLRTAPQQTCMTCHPAAPHAAAAAHVGTTPERHGELPLDARGAVQCWTCHDVHTAQVPAPRAPSATATALHTAAAAGSWSALPTGLRWPGGDRADHPAMLAAPIDAASAGPGDPTLCAACHGEGP